jgi:hypothetical protein
LQVSSQGQAYFLNVTRLVDKTLREYEQARVHLQRYINSNNKTSLFFRCVDHMENCVDSLHRVFQHMKKLRHQLRTLEDQTDQQVPRIGRNELPRSQDQDRIRRIRRAIQHIDKDIEMRSAGENIAPIGLIVKSDSIELDSEEIYFGELASWIEQVCKLTRRLIEYVPSAG